MPTLKQVLPPRFFEETTPEDAARRLLDVPVVAMKLATGPSCGGHKDLFEPWPGAEPYVRQWFLLDNGKAVGINENPDGPWSFPVAQRGTNGHER